MAISKDCGRCKGTGQMNKGYKDIWGTWHKTQRCDVCGGSGRNPDYREKRCEYHGGCYTTIVYSAKANHPPTLCPHHKEVVAREKQEANAKRERENRERADRQRQNQSAARANYPHENTRSENDRFNEACGYKGANLSEADKNGFRTYFHTLRDRQRMSFNEIVNLANEWKRNNGGGYRRSDRR